MADLLGRLFREGGTALIEAGTGIGKSFAYLTPAILSGQPVVVSTETIALQQQLVDKDLPRLAPILKEVTGRDITYAIAKGRSNYFCVRNAEEEEASFNFDSGGNPQVGASELLTEYRNGMWDGDRATLELPVSDLQWSVLAGDDSCQGSDCPNADECPYLEAKAKYKQADVVVANHRITMLHHRLLQETGFSLLPDHRLWVADEAHTVPDILGDTFGAEIKHNTHTAFLKRLERQLRQLKIHAESHQLNREGVARAAGSFFSCFKDPSQQSVVLDQLDAATLGDAKERAERLNEAFRPAVNLLGQLAAEYGTPGYDEEEETRQEPDSSLAAIKRLQRSAGQIQRGLRDILMTDEELIRRGDEVEIGKWVRYVELGYAKRGQVQDQSVTLHCKPIEVQPHFRRIRRELHACCFTSATLAGGGRDPWAATRREFGLVGEPVETFQAESPFDYARQVTGYIPAQSPLPSSDSYAAEIAQEIALILQKTRGRAFCLFTSHREMQEVYKKLAELRLPYPLLLQGEASKDQLLRDFREQKGAVLFGCKTFWTGVDIPGDTLSAVILVKLPFPNPSAPLVAARCKVIERQGGKSFFDYSVPVCIRDIKQGFGRLIRNETDLGFFAILDARMRTKSYGGTICKALPDFDIHDDLADCPFG